jgi:hypothetical protein
MESTRAKFWERLYNWAMEEWRREISEDFPLLKEVERTKGSFAHETLEIMQTLEKDQQWLMARALVLHTFQHFSLSLSDRLTERDKQLFELYRDMCRKIRGGEDASAYFKWLAAKNKLKRPKLRKCVIDSLRAILGERNKEWSSPSEFVYITPVGLFQIMTRIDTGGRCHQLSYHHRIVDSGYPDAIVYGQTPRVPLCDGALSLLSWLGVGQAMWSDLLDEDAEPVAKFLAKIIKHFIDAAPKLLEGLTPDD